MEKIQMVDLRSQYLRLQKEIDAAMASVLDSTHFINGPEVGKFSNNLSKLLEGSKVVTCGNGTDALQIAMMALHFKPGCEVILPAFTYIATAEVIGLLGLKPVLVDVDRRTFNIDVTKVEEAVGPRTVAAVPVHLFGQCADMQELSSIAKRRSFEIIEDAAQALGARCHVNGRTHPAGAIGKIGVTSFFPTKTIGCFGDGGAIFTSEEQLAEEIKMIANHGQRTKYLHELVGVNSRLDTLQAAILDVKLKHIDDFTKRRQRVAAIYDRSLKGLDGIVIPYRDENSTHVFHQYTLQVERRDELREHLRRREIPTMVYYPLPVHHQPAYRKYVSETARFPVAEQLANTVLSLPIHTEMQADQVEFICDEITKFYRGRA